MVQELGSSILDHSPIHIIGFVAHALNVAEPTNPPPPANPTSTVEPAAPRASGSGITLADLRIVPDQPAPPPAQDDHNAADAADEEEADPEGLGLGGDEMAVTGLTLLLAVLEGHPELSIASTPLLGLIFARLDAIAAGSESELVAPLAQEARMVLSARRAAGLAAAGPSSTPVDGEGAVADPLAASRKTYQEALVLLQDPLLPVRAQGLAHLKALVESDTALLQTDPALVPAILDIFLQAVEDDDSFLYLSAVQGLSGLVDREGKGMVRRLVRVYVGGGESGEVRRVAEVGVGEKGRRALERRLRVGEALGQVVERAGESLSRFADDLVPALLATMRAGELPTPLRASALTVLAGAVEAAPLALVGYADELAEASLTLLALESVQIKARIVPAPKAEDDEAEEEEGAEAEVPLGKDGRPRRAEETADPTGTDAKRQPSLRRAAVLLLGLLFRAAARLDEEELEKDQRRGAGVGEVQVEGLLGGGLRMPGGSRIGVRVPGSGVGGEGGAGARRGLVREVGQAAEAPGDGEGWQGLVRAGTREKARRVLRYVGETDVDGLVRYQAGEVLGELGEGQASGAQGVLGAEGLVRMLG